MSAFRIGNSTLSASAPAPPAPGAGEPPNASATADLVQKSADVYTKWIPGDALAIYIALTTAFRGTLSDTEKGGLTPHAWGLLVAGLAFAGGLCLLGSILNNLGHADPALRPIEIAGRVLLAILAFGFWSLTVPGAWWEIRGWNQGVLAALAFAISVGFALVAELVVAVLKPGPP